MPPILALMIGIAVVLYLYKKDSANSDKISGSFWIFSIWFMVQGSRPLTLWTARSMVVGDNTGTEGNPVNLIFGLFFAIVAIIILSNKKVNFGEVIRLNSPLFFLTIYCLVSCAWSDFPFVSLRRWIRYVFDMLIIMAILTEISPYIAIKTIVRRYAIFAAPISLVLIKYYPKLATGWNSIGSEKMWTGVCTHKNTLGVGLSVILLFYVWKYLIVKDKKGKWTDIFIVIISSYIMFNPGVKGSSTSIIVTIIGVSFLFIMRYFKQNIRRFTFIFYLLIGSFFVADTVLKVSINKSIVEIVTVMSGRDMTFTGRTFIWEAVLQLANNHPLIGSGYGTFWTGHRLFLLSSNPYVGTIKQSHNGYIETYANLGIVGTVLLAYLLLSSLHKRIRSIESNFELNSIGICIILMLVVSEFFEATMITPSSFKWITFLLFTIDMPVIKQPESRYSI